MGFKDNRTFVDALVKTGDAVKITKEVVIPATIEMQNYSQILDSVPSTE